MPVKLEVKEFKDKQNTLYVAVSLEAIKKPEVSKQGTAENSVAQSSYSVTVSISDIFSKINPEDTNFLKYIPNQGSIYTKRVKEGNIVRIKKEASKTVNHHRQLVIIITRMLPMVVYAILIKMSRKCFPKGFRRIMLTIVKRMLYML